jgi:hypothetical protein
MTRIWQSFQLCAFVALRLLSRMQRSDMLSGDWPGHLLVGPVICPQSAVSGLHCRSARQTARWLSGRIAGNLTLRKLTWQTLTNWNLIARGATP